MTNISYPRNLWGIFALRLFLQKTDEDRFFFLVPVASHDSVWWSGGYSSTHINPYPTAFPYGNGMVLHFYQQQESSTTKTVHKVMNKGLKMYV